MRIVRAKIKNKTAEWEEKFEIPKNEEAEAFVKSIVDDFNATLTRGETAREFVGFVENKETDISKYLSKIIGECNREERNAYGNAYIKHNFKKIHSLYLKSRGKITIRRFLNFVKQAHSQTINDYAKICEEQLSKEGKK